MNVAHDFKEMILALERAGMTDAAIALRLGVEPSTVHRWKMGSEPKFSLGVRLIAIYQSSIAATQESIAQTQTTFVYKLVVTPTM